MWAEQRIECFTITVIRRSPGQNRTGELALCSRLHDFYDAQIKAVEFKKLKYR